MSGVATNPSSPVIPNSTPAASANSKITPVYSSKELLNNAVKNTGSKYIYNPFKAVGKAVYDTSGAIKKSVVNTRKSISSSAKTYQINKSVGYAEKEFEKEKQKHIDKKLSELDPKTSTEEDKMKARTNAIKEITEGNIDNETLKNAKDK
jgi:hypothetical protein